MFQNLDSEKEKELERQARIEASLREREREVQKARSEQTKEIDREREQHKREEAIQNFKALLSDMVRYEQVLSWSIRCRSWSVHFADCCTTKKLFVNCSWIYI